MISSANRRIRLEPAEGPEGPQLRRPIGERRIDAGRLALRFVELVGEDDRPEGGQDHFTSG